MDNQFFLKIKEFIQFEIFIAEDVLTVFYVVCALILPFVFWYFFMWVIRRYAVLIRFYKDGKYSIFFSFIMWFIRRIKFFQKKIDEKITWQSFTWSQKLKFIVMFLIKIRWVYFHISPMYLKFCMQGDKYHFQHRRCGWSLCGHRK